VSFVKPYIIRTQQRKAAHAMKNNPWDVETLSGFGCPG
jgi:hypothetical protein